ncbi:hypothetical protein Tco_0370311 [Tanacetum coccineum]
MLQTTNHKASIECSARIVTIPTCRSSFVAMHAECKREAIKMGNVCIEIKKEMWWWFSEEKLQEHNSKTSDAFDGFNSLIPSGVRVIDGHLGVKGAQPPCGVKGQCPLQGQGTEPLARVNGIFGAPRRKTVDKGKGKGSVRPSGEHGRRGLMQLRGDDSGAHNSCFVIPATSQGKGVFLGKANSYGSVFQQYVVEGSRDQEAIDDEIGSIMENNTWVLSDLPLVETLGCQIDLHKRKMKVDEQLTSSKLDCLETVVEIGTRVFIFPRCKTKRITYVNMKFCRFKKLGLGFLYAICKGCDLRMPLSGEVKGNPVPMSYMFLSRSWRSGTVPEETKWDCLEPSVGLGVVLPWSRWVAS